MHNLEHGYTILWYGDAIGVDEHKLELIERISKTFSAAGQQAGKFIAAPYTATDGGDPWPAGKTIAFTHWGGGEPQTQKGYRQFCGDISGEALQQFMNQHPATDSPEPTAG